MDNLFLSRIMYFKRLIKKRPLAAATIRGSSSYPNLQGEVYFFQTEFGVLIVTQIKGLPVSDGVCANRFFGFHIHSGESCTGNAEEEFSDSLTHYNPDNCEHPNHAGDLPPLLSDEEGYAFSIVLSDRFTVEDILGKTVIVHSKPDDFTTQPSGNSGAKIACGVITG